MNIYLKKTAFYFSVFPCTFCTIPLSYEELSLDLFSMRCSSGAAFQLSSIYQTSFMFYNELDVTAPDPTVSRAIEK